MDEMDNQPAHMTPAERLYWKILTSVRPAKLYPEDQPAAEWLFEHDLIIVGMAQTDKGNRFPVAFPCFNSHP